MITGSERKTLKVLIRPKQHSFLSHLEGGRVKDAWEAERRAEGVWRDVRVYDADDMETWLETAPAVHVWLSVELGTHPKDALDLESVWGDWSHSTDPSITMQLVLAGRKGLANKVIDWLVKSSETTLALRAESCQEALAVFAATILDYSGSEREWLLSRIVVVDTVATWNALTLSNEILILIPRFRRRRSARTSETNRSPCCSSPWRGEHE